ncbi:MAG: hypothetical protein KF824_11925 [Fimbriimonadaceae bacterium]|nr:MAG: hypothetical protein KF824_11925 [Fimbriimonadaceae bacterium]
MKERSLLAKNEKRWTTYGAAFALSLLTLAVFAYSKDTGPESAVKRYQQAIAEGDMDGAAHYEFSQGRYSGVLAAQIRDILRYSRRIQLGGVKKNGREAFVDVVYELPQPGNMMAIRFVVKKPDLKWKVDAEQTVRLLTRMQQFE